MAKRPNRFLRWAYGALAGAIVEPVAGVASAGFAQDTRAPAPWFNYLFNLAGGWIDFLRGPSLGDWTRRTAGPATWAPPSGDALNRYVCLAIDTTTPEREVAPVRYAMVGQVGGSPDLKVWSSRRGVGWTDVSSKLPGGYIADWARGIIATSGRWVFWTGGQIFSGLRDTAAATSPLDATGPNWAIATLPGTVNAVRDVAYDSASATWCLAYDTTGSVTARFAYSLDGAVTFAVAGFTAGPPTGNARAVARTATHFVVVTSTGEVWRSTGNGVNFALAGTLPASSTWQLAYGGGLLVAWEYKLATTRIYTSSDSGVTWVALTVPAGVRNLTRLLYVDSAWVASSTDAPWVWQSNDLVTWTRAVLPQPETPDPLYDLAYGEGALYAAGNGISYQSDRAADAGPGPADGLTAPAPLSDAAYLRGRLIATTAPTDQQVLVWNNALSRWEPGAPAPTRFSPVDFLLALGAPTTSAGSFSVGVKFVTLRALSCTGVRFRWAGGAATVRVRLRNAAGTSLATVDVVVGGAGTYTGTFGAPVALTANTRYAVTQWETGGASYTNTPTAGVPAPAVPFVSADIVFENLAAFAAGDANPTSTSGTYFLTEPVLA